MDVHRIAGSLCAAALAVGVAGCGTRDSARNSGSGRLPPSGHAYRALDRGQRAAVAARCRDEIARRHRGVTARDLRAVNPVALRDQLDADYSVIAEQRRPVADVCREAIPYVTPGLRLTIDGAKDRHDGTFSTETTSNERLRLAGRVTPAPPGAYVVARRDVGPPVVRRAVIDRHGHFALPPVALRKIADNTFTITIHAAPHARRQALFTAICLDCLSGGPPPGSA